MYALLKILVRFSLIAYFRKIRIEGKEKIKKGQPYILISNHPSAFMDPISIGVNIKPTIYFLAAGEYMGRGFKFWFMNRFLNMIPVYRPETMPTKTHKNDAIFEKCIAHLNSGRTILVFPEGVSSPDKKIIPLKTGVARIARATELSKDLQANIQIIPIGLNYSDPHKFRSDLFINVGDPIKAADFFSTAPENEQEEVKALTDHMEKALIDTVLHMEELEYDELLTKVNETYMRDLKTELGVEYTDQQREFELNKLMLSAFSYFRENAPAKYEEMRAELDKYFGILAEHNIHDRELRKVDDKMNIAQWLMMIIGAPFFIFGLVSNIIPYQLTTALQGKIDVKDTFRGSINLAVGIVIFLLWYALITVFLVVYTPLSYFGLLAIVVLYFSGLHVLIYSNIFRYLNKRKKLRRYFKEHPNLKDELLWYRNDLIKKFEDFRNEFSSRN
ncbi:MAG: 1-acyl-sn-glycerol-3-phosphate acyltransferase [Crocinitomicaceae bacterium]|nr:1-acyl-sn-glycerol-3-phosphate acyltransferase [Crocinitomicaceae bacterium]